MAKVGKGWQGLWQGLANVGKGGCVLSKSKVNQKAAQENRTVNKTESIAEARNRE